MTPLKNLLAAIFLVLLICAPNVSAKILTDKVPLLTFAEIEIPVYDAPNGTKKGSIPPEKSLVQVKEIQADGWAYGSYKPSNSTKRVYRWFKMTELQGYEDFENYVDQLTRDSTAYRTRSSSNAVGAVSSDEDVIVVAKRGGRTKIIFKADGNFYRMGWVDNDLLNQNSSDDNSYSSDDNSYSSDDSSYSGGDSSYYDINPGSQYEY